MTTFVELVTVVLKALAVELTSHQKRHDPVGYTRFVFERYATLTSMYGPWSPAHDSFTQFLESLPEADWERELREWAQWLGRLNSRRGGRTPPAQMHGRGSAGRRVSSLRSPSVALLPAAQVNPAANVRPDTIDLYRLTLSPPAPAPVLGVEGLYSADPVLNKFLAHADEMEWFTLSPKEFKANANSYAATFKLDPAVLCLTVKAKKGRGAKRVYHVSREILSKVRSRWVAERERRGGAKDVRVPGDWWRLQHKEFEAELAGVGWLKFQELVLKFKP